MAARRPMTDKQREINSTSRAHERMERVATRENAIREAQHGQQRIATESQLASNSRNRRVQNKVQDTVASKTASTLTPSSNSNIVMTVIFMIIGLTIMYQLVTQAGNVATLQGSISDFLHKLSSTDSLFQVKTNTTSTNNGGIFNPGGSPIIPPGFDPNQTTA